MKSGKSGKCEKKSTLNVKSGRSGKCEKIYAKCEKKFGQLHDQSNGQFGQFGQLFFRHFRVSGCQHFKS